MDSMTSVSINDIYILCWGDLTLSRHSGLGMVTSACPSKHPVGCMYVKIPDDSREFKINVRLFDGLPSGCKHTKLMLGAVHNPSEFVDSVNIIKLLCYNGLDNTIDICNKTPAIFSNEDDGDENKFRHNYIPTRNTTSGNSVSISVNKTNDVAFRIDGHEILTTKFTRFMDRFLLVVLSASVSIIPFHINELISNSNEI